MRYEIVGDVVRDHKTGLEWQRTLAGPMTWAEAVKHAASLGGEWRLPTVTEHIAMINYERSAPATDFPGETGRWCWSSSSSAGSASDAWYVNFSYGYVSNGDKANTYYVRYARSGRGWCLGSSDLLARAEPVTHPAFDADGATPRRTRRDGDDRSQEDEMSDMRRLDADLRMAELELAEATADEAEARSALAVRAAEHSIIGLRRDLLVARDVLRSARQATLDEMMRRRRKEAL